MTVTMEDITTDLDINFDEDVPCVESTNTGCTAPAKWRKQHVPCGHGVDMFCENHKKEMDEFFDSPGVNVCTPCSNVVERLQWTRL